MAFKCPQCNSKTIRHDRSLAGRAVCAACGMALSELDSRQAGYSIPLGKAPRSNIKNQKATIAWLIPVGLLGVLYVFANPRTIDTGEAVPSPPPSPPPAASLPPPAPQPPPPPAPTLTASTTSPMAKAIFEANRKGSPNFVSPEEMGSYRPPSASPPASSPTQAAPSPAQAAPSPSPVDASSPQTSANKIQCGANGWCNVATAVDGSVMSVRIIQKRGIGELGKANIFGRPTPYLFYCSSPSKRYRTIDQLTWTEVLPGTMEESAFDYVCQS